MSKIVVVGSFFYCDNFPLYCSKYKTIVKLREVKLNITHLKNEIDDLPEDTRFRERKLHDMTLRLDGPYDTIVELKEKIVDVKLLRKAVEQDVITLENIYNLHFVVIKRNLST